MLPLSPGAFKDLFHNNGILSEPIIVQLTDLKQIEENECPGTCAKARLFDGMHICEHFRLSSSLSAKINDDGLRDNGTTFGDILLINKIHVSPDNANTRSKVMIIDDYDILAKDIPLLDSDGLELPSITAVDTVNNDIFTSMSPAEVPDSVETSPPAISHTKNTETTGDSHGTTNNLANSSNSSTPTAVKTTIKTAKDPPFSIVSTNEVNNCAAVTAPVDSTETSKLALVSSSSEPVTNLPASITSVSTPKTKTSAIVPISCVNLALNFSKYWKIPGMCVQKANLSSIRNGTSWVLNFVLYDGTGKIQVTAFGESAKRANTIIRSHCSYEITGMHVTPRNSRYNNTLHPFAVTLKDGFEIFPLCGLEPQTPVFELNLCSLDMVGQQVGNIVNVLAVVEKLDPVSDFVTKNGMTFIKKDIFLIDKTGSIIFTLWGDRARRFEDNALGQTIWITAARIKAHKGIMEETKWKLSPSLPEADSLHEWYLNECLNMKTEKLSIRHETDRRESSGHHQRRS